MLFEGVTKFNLISGLKPNPSKSLCFFCNVSIEVRDFALSCIGFSKGALPIVYLGLLLVSSKLTTHDCQPLVTKICRGIKHRSCKSINQAGRVQLIKSVMYGIQGYWATRIFLPKCILVQQIFSQFLWKGATEVRCHFKVASVMI